MLINVLLVHIMLRVPTVPVVLRVITLEQGLPTVISVQRGLSLPMRLLVVHLVLQVKLP